MKCDALSVSLYSSDCKLYKLLSTSQVYKISAKTDLDELN